MEEQKKINVWMIVSILLAGVIVGYGASKIPSFLPALQQAAVIGNSGEAAKVEKEAKTKAPTFILNKEQIDKIADDDPFIGSADAPVTIVEFSDFQCPYCQKFFERTFPAIEEKYIKSGKVKFVYRDFPINGHTEAELAALAGQCAHEQGRFREMHDILFEEQMQWSGNPEAKKAIKGFGVKAGLDVKKFNSCIDNKKYADEVRADFISGASMGVKGTPAFFINGKYLSGAMPFEGVFQPIIEAALAGQNWELEFDGNGVPGIRVGE